MSNRTEMIKALKSHAQGHIDKHKMNVNVYLDNSVGIGEHPDVLEAIEKVSFWGVENGPEATKQ